MLECNFFYYIENIIKGMLNAFIIQQIYDMIYDTIYNTTCLNGED